MTFNVVKLILDISDYMSARKAIMFDIVKDHDPYCDEEYDYASGLMNMNDKGFPSSTGNELKGQMDAFELVLRSIERIMKGGV